MTSIGNTGTKGGSMAADDSPFEEQALADLTEVQSKLEAAKAQRDTLDEKITQLTETARGYEMVLQYQRMREIGDGVTPDWARLLKKLTHKKRIIEIARHSEGQVRKADAADILYSTGFMKAKSRPNAYTAVQEIFADLVEEGVLERTDKPGIYRLIEEVPAE